MLLAVSLSRSRLLFVFPFRYHFLCRQIHVCSFSWVIAFDKLNSSAQIAISLKMNVETTTEPNAKTKPKKKQQQKRYEYERND